MAACTELTRKLRSEAAKRRWADPEFKEKVSLSIRIARARGYSEETEQRMSAAALRRWNNLKYRTKRSEDTKKLWADPEYRKHMSEVHKGIMAGENHPMFGRKMPAELKEKLRAIHIGKPSHQKGKTHTIEVRERLSKSHRGVPLSEKHRASIGKANKRVS